MEPEIKGKDWNKEIVTSKDATQGGPDDAKRTDFYEKRVNFKSGLAFDDIVGDLTGKGYKTMDDLKPFDFSHEIKAGDTLFPVLKEYFLTNCAPSMTPDQAEKEAYLSLAFVMKNNPGINVDDLRIKGQIKINAGHLTVSDVAGTATINGVPIRPEAVTAVVDPNAVPPVSTEPVPVAPGLAVDPNALPVPPVELVDPGVALKAPSEAVSVVADGYEDWNKIPDAEKLKVNGPHKFDNGFTKTDGVYKDGRLFDGTITLQDNTVWDRKGGDLAGIHSPDGSSKIGKFILIEFVTPTGKKDKKNILIEGLFTDKDGTKWEGKWNDQGFEFTGVKTSPDGNVVNYTGGIANEKVDVIPTDLTLAQIDGENVVGKYVDPNSGDISEGTFNKGILISGKYTYSGGATEEGTFAQDSGFLISGTYTSADGKTRENGVFDPIEGDPEYHLIDGVKSVEGQPDQYIFPEAKLAEIEAKVKDFRPETGYEKIPYMSNGNNVIFQKSKWFWQDYPVVGTVENPDKAKQLADALNARYGKPVEVVPVAPVAPAEPIQPPVVQEQVAPVPDAIPVTPVAPSVAPAASNATSAPVVVPDKLTE